ncbi:MAG: hypothetical protein ACYS0D_16365, partial [Planctomycetota bacterium]
MATGSRNLTTLSRALLRLVGVVVLVVAGSTAAQNMSPQTELTAPSVDEVKARIGELEALGETIDEEGKTRLELSRNALGALQSLAQAVSQRAQYEQEIAQAPMELEAVRAS